MATRRIGVVAERKADEHRVALTPEGVADLVAHDVEVVVEHNAGAGVGLDDAAYAAAGARLVGEAAEVWGGVDILCKVKEPQRDELGYLRGDLTLFTYLHLAAYPEVAHALVAAGTTGIAYETVQTPDGALPLLAPMSEIAGRMASQIVAHYLERPHGTRGILMGGAVGVPGANVVVLGAGAAGAAAAQVAVGMDATVTVIDQQRSRLETLEHRLGIRTLAAGRGSIAAAVEGADAVIGAVLSAGGRAPVLIDEALVARMGEGAVVVDLAVDQGGCIATTRETTHHDPTYVVHGVIHYAVGNIPGAVPRTATYALTNATLPYVRALAVAGEAAWIQDRSLAAGVNTYGGGIVHPAVAAALGVTATPLDGDGGGC